MGCEISPIVMHTAPGASCTAMLSDNTEMVLATKYWVFLQNNLALGMQENFTSWNCFKLKEALHLI